MAESPDEENSRLALALLDDDKSALEEILRLYGPAIANVLNGKYTTRMGVLRFEDIEDVMSIALQRVWDGRKSYDDRIRPLRAWFYCIADNVAKDVLKHGWHKARCLERHAGQDWLADSLRTPDPKPEHEPAQANPKQSKKFQDLKTSFAKLPEVQQKILLADAVTEDGVASSEVLAEELDIPEANVRVYRKRGLDRLRDEMRKLGHDIS